MDRTHLLIVAFAVSIALLVPSSAWPYDPTGVDRPDEMDDIVLAPADGANGEYAVINGDGEIEILIGEMNPYVDTEGVSKGSVSTIPRIFTVTNAGSESVTVWITDDVDALQYVRGDQEYESVEGRPNRVTLGPNETVGIGLTIDARDEVAVKRADSFSVHASGIKTDRRETDQSEPTSVVSTTVSEEAATSTPGPDETVTGTGSLSDATETSTTSADGDGRSRALTDGETNTPTVTPTPAEEGVLTQTQTVSAPSTESRQSPANERNRRTATGARTGSLAVRGLLVFLLAVLAVVLALLREAREES